MKVVAGFDPGLDGGWACVRSDGKLLATDMLPVAGVGTKRMISAPLLFDALRQWNADVAIVELVSAMPKQGVSSSFRFGQAVGVVKGVVGSLLLPLEEVSAAKWKKHFGLSSDKEASRALALKRWPDKASLFARKMDHQRAEAALIALYYIETQGGER